MKKPHTIKRDSNGKPWIPLALNRAPSDAFPMALIQGMAGHDRKRDAAKQSGDALSNDAFAIVAELAARDTEDSGARLAAIAQAALSALRHSKSPSALPWRIGALQSAVQELNEDAQSNRPTFRKHYGERPAWPVLYSPNPAFATDTTEAAKGIGHRDLSILDARGARKMTGATRLAACVFSCLQDNRRRWAAPAWREKLENNPALPSWAKDCASLPEFSTASSVEWVEVGWRCILEKFNGHPERDDGDDGLVAILKPSVRGRDSSFIRGELKGAFKKAMLALPRK